MNKIEIRRKSILLLNKASDCERENIHHLLYHNILSRQDQHLKEKQTMKNDHFSADIVLV